MLPFRFLSHHHAADVTTILPESLLVTTGLQTVIPTCSPDSGSSIRVQLLVDICFLSGDVEHGFTLNTKTF
jgi:hypothetical protein